MQPFARSIAPHVRHSTAGPAREIALAALLSILVCGCTYSGGAVRWTQKEGDDAPPKASPEAGLAATLRPVGSAVAGKVRVIDRGDGVSVMLSTNNLIQGGVYRMAFHRNPNCTSPNAFSAGPAWAPPGMNPTTLIPTFYQTTDGSTEIEVHVSGVHTQGESGLAGKSIVLYQGSTIPEIKPDVPNNALACGVFEPVVPFRL